MKKTHSFGIAIDLRGLYCFFTVSKGLFISKPGHPYNQHNHPLRPRRRPARGLTGIFDYMVHRKIATSHECGNPTTASSYTRTKRRTPKVAPKFHARKIKSMIPKHAFPAPAGLVTSVTAIWCGRLNVVSCKPHVRWSYQRNAANLDDHDVLTAEIQPADEPGSTTDVESLKSCSTSRFEICLPSAFRSTPSGLPISA